jgi:hypothetical protein
LAQHIGRTWKINQQRTGNAEACDTNHINKDLWKRGTAETHNTYLKGGKEQNTTSQTSPQEKRDDSRCKKTGQEAHYFITCGINSGNAKQKYNSQSLLAKTGEWTDTGVRTI